MQRLEEASAAASQQAAPLATSQANGQYVNGQKAAA
jgi:hypothetical protein